VEALYTAGHDQTQLLPTLLSGLTERDRLPRIRAYRLLLSMPSAARNATPQLRELARDERAYVRQVALRLLEELREAVAEPGTPDEAN
jgi:hypothetical protein